MRSLAILIVMLFLDGSASLANCGNTISSTPLKGVFQYLPLDDKCGSIGGLTTTLTDAAPLFSLQSTISGACVWNIATVINERIATIARVDDDLFGSTVAAAPDDTYWYVSDNRYVKVAASDAARRTSVPPFAIGFTPTTIGTTARGEVYSIERRVSQGQENDLRLVTIADGTSVKIPLRGSNESLNRASNGRLYFRLFENWHCHIFEITDSGAPVDRIPCYWQNGNGIAVDPKGAIWQPSFLSIVQIDASGHISRSIGPVAPMPCDIYGWMGPHVIIADGQGVIWFIYDKLWRVDPHGKISSISFPVAQNPSSMVETSDGSLWFPGKDASGKDALVHFVPAADVAAGRQHRTQ
jgi:hypothetical protein